MLFLLVYKIGIRGLCEMQLTGSGKMKKDGKTLIYTGHWQDHILGVRMYLSSTVAKTPIGWKPINEHIITARFQTRHVKVTIIQADAPTMENDDNKKDNFYKILDNIVDQIPRHDIKSLMGDFDVQIYKSRQGMESITGPNGPTYITNNNGE